jgi:hypothetical protein
VPTDSVSLLRQQRVKQSRRTRDSKKNFVSKVCSLWIVFGSKKKMFALPSLAMRLPFPEVRPHPSFRGVLSAATCKGMITDSNTHRHEYRRSLYGSQVLWTQKHAEWSDTLTKWAHHKRCIPVPTGPTVGLETLGSSKNSVATFSAWAAFQRAIEMLSGTKAYHIRPRVGSVCR